MPRTYDKNFKAMIVNLIVNQKHSTLATAKQFDIPLKTLEKWITAYNKNPHCFDSDNVPNDFKIISPPNTPIDYDDLNCDELKKLLMKKRY